MYYMARAREESQRYVDPDGKIHSEWEIFLGLRSGRIESIERTGADGYLVDREVYCPVDHE